MSADDVKIFSTYAVGRRAAGSARRKYIIRKKYDGVWTISLSRWMDEETYELTEQEADWITSGLRAEAVFLWHARSKEQGALHPMEKGEPTS